MRIPRDAPAQAECQARAVSLTDFDELAQAFPGWDVRFRQLSRGPFSATIRVVRAGAVEVMHLSLNRVIQARGVPGHQACVFSPVLPVNQGAVWRGERLRPGQINLLGPRDVMDHRTTPTYEHLALRVYAGPLREWTAALHGVDVEDWLNCRGPFTPRPDDSARLSALLWGALRTAGAGGLLRPGGAGDLEHEALRLLLRCLAGARVGGVANGPPRARAVALRRAEEYLEANLNQPLCLRDLCEAAEASERTLGYAFLERFGLTPMAYVKARRLNAVRHELKRASSDTLALHQVARRWGFWHTGAFAADYRRQFGELPSQTLDRPRPSG